MEEVVKWSATEDARENRNDDEINKQHPLRRDAGDPVWLEIRKGSTAANKKTATNLHCINSKTELKIDKVQTTPGKRSCLQKPE